MKSKTKKTALQKHVEKLIQAEGGVRKAATALGVDKGYLVRLRDGAQTNPGPDTLQKLGLVVDIQYREIGEGS